MSSILIKILDIMKISYYPCNLLILFVLYFFLELITNGVSKHWEIENKIHWVLNIIFNEDYSHKRNGNCAKNFININRLTLNILRTNNRNINIRRKRNLADWKNNYMEKLLKI